MPSLAVNKSPAIVSVEFTSAELRVLLNDGRSLGLPLHWYPTLLGATDAQRADWRLLGNGEGVHWESLDEDLSLEGFLNGWPAAGSRAYNEARQRAVGA